MKDLWWLSSSGEFANIPKILPMETVAHFLQKEAINRSGRNEADLFGRSAFNRYYYALFLCVRNSLSKCDPKWAALPHSNYPDLLKGQIKTEIKHHKKRARKANDYNLIKTCETAIHATHELAELMKKGYAVRTVADYNPDIPISFIDGKRFCLNSIEITEAHNWISRARNWSDIIVSVWNDIHA